MRSFWLRMKARNIIRVSWLLDLNFKKQIMFPLCFQAVYWPLGIVSTYKFPEEIYFPLSCFPGISYAFLLMSILSIKNTQREQMRRVFPMEALGASSAPCRLHRKVIGSGRPTDPGQYFLNAGEMPCFCKYRNTSLFQYRGENGLCLQRQGQREGSGSGLGTVGGCCSDSC